MKKYISIVCIGLCLFLSVNISSADLSQSQQENYKKQIESVCNNFSKSISGLDKIEQKKKLDLIQSKIEKAKQTKLSEKNSFVMNYLGELLKNKSDLLQNDLDKVQKELEEKQANELKAKQEKEIKEKRTSRDDRLIGTVEITAPNYSYDKEKHLVYEIIMTNHLVKGYELKKNLKTGKFETDYNNKLDNGFYDKNTKEIYVAYHRWRYEYIMQDLMTFDNSFTIKGTDVFYGIEKIGIFYPDQLQIQKENDIPLTQGCTEYWSDNTVDKIYYDKNSKFFNDILDKRKYNYDYSYFCTENEAILAGYKKSLN